MLMIPEERDSPGVRRDSGKPRRQHWKSSSSPGCPADWESSVLAPGPWTPWTFEGPDMVFNKGHSCMSVLWALRKGDPVMTQKKRKLLKESMCTVTQCRAGMLSGSKMAQTIGYSLLFMDHRSPREPASPCIWAP